MEKREVTLFSKYCNVCAAMSSPQLILTTTTAYQSQKEMTLKEAYVPARARRCRQRGERRSSGQSLEKVKWNMEDLLNKQLEGAEQEKVRREAKRGDFYRSVQQH